MKKPHRPTYPLLLIPLAASWLAIVLAAEINYQNFTIPVLISVIAALLSVCVVYARFKTTARLSITLVSVFVFLLAFSSGNSFYQALAKQARECSELEGTQRLQVIEDTRTYSNSRVSEVSVLGSNTGAKRLRAFWNNKDLSLHRGTLVQASCTVSPLKEEQRWLFNKGVVATLSMSNLEVLGFEESLQGALDKFRLDNLHKIEAVNDGQGGALLAGVLLGYRELLQDSALEQDFITCGLSHLIAVSGSHLAVIAALLAWVLKGLPLGRPAQIALLLLLLIAYVTLTGLQPSAIRSAIMAGVSSSSLFVGRRGHVPSALCATAIVMLVLYPPNNYSVGFWLSVIAVLGISVFSGLIAFWLSSASPFKNKNTPGALSSALSLTLSASSATLAIAVPVFAVVSLIGPLANILVAPIISVVLLLGVLALVLPEFLLGISTLLLYASTSLSEIAAWIAAALAKLPFASLPLHVPEMAVVVFGVLLGLTVYLVWPCPSSKCLRRVGAVLIMGALILCLFIPRLSPPRLIVMDIGQGDALLVQEQGANILIDTGASPSELTHALARNNISRLDKVIITHLDDDHGGALGRLRGLVVLDSIYFARGLLASQYDHPSIVEATTMVGEQNVRELGCGDEIALGSTLTLRVVWPQREVTAGSNEESLCLLLSYDANDDGVPESQTLLTGDAEENELAGILASQNNLQVEVLKVGHHGSAGAVSREQLQQLSCGIALISVGANNNYGHPSSELLELFYDAGVRVYRTDENGDIRLTFDGQNIQVSYATMVEKVH